MFKVCIDPGHGGSDRANRGSNGYVEADGVLAISKYLKEELESTGQFQVILTRDRDKTLTLTERGRIAARNKVDLFIAQHTNAGPKGAGGTEVYYSVDIPGDRELAEKLSKAVADTLGIQDRGAKTKPSTKNPSEDYYTVIDVAQDGGIPHVLLVESAFHSNPDEERLLMKDENLRKIAQAQAKVICEFFGVQYSQQANVYVVQSGDTLWGIAQKFNISVDELARINNINDTAWIWVGQKLYLSEDTKLEPKQEPKQVEGNENVKALQHLCNLLGIKDMDGRVLVEDGIIGPRTRYAVSRLPLCGLKYIQRLATKYIQQRLNDLGFTDNAGRKLVVDGIFGKRTMEAVMKFQRAHGLVVDGVVGPKTWAKLLEV